MTVAEASHPTRSFERQRKADMREAATATVPDIAEQQKVATALLGSAMSTSAEPMLKAQADLLASAESTMTDWLHRRREAVADTQRLVSRLHGSTDPAEFLKVQQEWMAGVFNRLAADATAYQSATQRLMDHARSWFSQSAESTASQVATATRAAAKPLQMAAKAE
jgi:hypothetical protein